MHYLSYALQNIRILLSFIMEIQNYNISFIFKAC